MEDIEQYLKISDYTKPKDYQFSSIEFDELHRINRMLENCVSYDFTKLNTIILIDYYIYFFEEIGRFELLFLGFKSLRELAKDEALYDKQEFKNFMFGLGANFDTLNDNLVKESFENIHYYDVSFISDIEQFRQSLDSSNSIVCDIDFF